MCQGENEQHRRDGHRPADAVRGVRDHDPVLRAACDIEIVEADP
jgi:hypothetical protein